MSVKPRKVPRGEGQLSPCGLGRQTCVHAANICGVNSPQCPHDESFSSLTRNSSGPFEQECNNRGESELDSSSSSSRGPDATLLSSLPGSRPKRDKGEPPQGMEEKYSRAHRPRQPVLGKRPCSRHRCRCSRPWGCRTSGGCGDVRDGYRNNSRRSSRWGAPWYLNWSVRSPGRLADARWIIILFGLFLLALPDSAHSYYLEDKIGNQTVCGSVRLINDFDNVGQYENCTIIDGSIFIGMTKVAPTPDQVFSKLTEITGYLSAYRNFELTSFQSLFPKLRVIRGRETMHNFALVIYQNRKMEDISLNSLTSVMRGAVRVNQNAVLCYVDTVNWPRIVKKSFMSKSVLKDNRDPGQCLLQCFSCDKHNNNCWNDQHCQTDACRTLQCGSGVFCNDDDPVEPFCCDRECEGGCYAPGDASQCVACKNYRQRDTCVPDCQKIDGATFYRLREWRCVTRDECLSMEIGMTDHMTYTTADEVLEDGQLVHSCVLACPKNQEKGPDGSCLPCNGTCKKPACLVHDAVTNLGTMKDLKDCTEINGDLVIQLDLSEQELAKYLGKIRVIQGQLRVTNTHNLTSLSFLESLEEIRGDSLRGEGSGVAAGMTHSSQRVEYVIQLIHNKQLKKLFDWDRHRAIKVPRDKRILAMFNRKLCLRELEEAVKQFNFSVSFDTMKREGDISPSSNGDLAICTTQRLGVRLAWAAANTAIWWLEWDGKSGDYRKLIALLAYYRPVEQGENATYFDSNWQVRELWGGGDDTKEDRPDVCLLQYLQPYTHYAMYISSLSVGTDEVISDIKYFWTKPHKPGPVHGMEVVPKVLPDGRYYFNLRWLPPEKPNGKITHYKVRMRQMEGSFKRLRSMDFCNLNLPTSQVRYHGMHEEAVPDVPAILQNATAEQCRKSCGCVKDSSGTLEEEEAYELKEADIQMEIDFENMLQNNLFIKRPEDNDTDTNQTTTTMTTTEHITGMTTRAAVVIGGNIPGQKPPYATDPRGRGGKDGLDPSESEEEEDLKLCPCPVEPTTTPEPTQVNATTVNSTGYNGTTATFTGLNGTTANFTGFNNVTTASTKLCPCPKPKLCPCHVNVTINGTWEEVPSQCPCPDSVDEDPLVFNHTFWARDITDGIEMGFIPIGLDSNLSYFTDYLIEVVACNVNYSKSCSFAMTHGARTEANSSADTVDNKTITQTPEVNSTSNAILVKWAEPPQPNGAILKYSIVLTRPGSSQSESRCVSIKQYKQFGGGFELSEAPGRYDLKIGAYSMNYVGDDVKYSDPVVLIVKDRDSENRGTPAWVVAVIVIFCFIALGVALGLLVFWKLRKRGLPLEAIYTSANVNYPTTDFYNTYKVDGWELDRENIQLLNELGQGSFGMVFDGILKDGDQEMDVAVKTLKIDATYHDRIDFLNEASVMKEFTECWHVVKLLGVVSVGSPVLVIMELMHQGDLRNYLRRRRPDEPDTIGPQPKPHEIYLMAAQITDGMAYLADKKFVHRDLAARNCMVGVAGEGTVVKIGDFGMTRDVYLSDYYRKNDKGMLPVRWMAPESLKDGVFTAQSDIWSYGVVMWEMVTLAAQPYQGMSNEQVLTFVSKGGTITMPENCPTLLYNLMSRCFTYWAKYRPTFADILQEFKPYLTDEFRDVAYLCSELREKYVAKQAGHQSASHTPSSQGPLSASEGDKCDNVLLATETHDGSVASGRSPPKKEQVEIELESFEPSNGRASATYWKTQKTPDSPPNNAKNKAQHHSNSNGSAGSWMPPRQRSVKGGRGSRVHDQSCSRAGHNSTDSDEPCECQPMTPSSGGGDSKGSERSGKNGFANGSIPQPMDGLASG